MKALRMALVSLSLWWGSAAEAGLVSPAEYRLDPVTGVVSNGVVEWFQWPVTTGMSVSDALGQYAAAGWQVATASQMADLYGVFFPGRDWPGVVRNDKQLIAEVTRDEFIAFRDRFGVTLDLFAGVMQIVYRADMEDDEHYLLAWCDYAASVPNAGLGYHEPHLSPDFRRFDYGIALVRRVERRSMPEPASLTLLLGMFGLAGKYCRRSSRRHSGPAS